MRTLSLILLLCLVAVAVEGSGHKSRKCSSSKGGYIGRPCGRGRVCVRAHRHRYGLTCRSVHKVSKKHCCRGGKWCPGGYRCFAFNKHRACFPRFKCRYYGQYYKGRYCLSCGHGLCCRPQFHYSARKSCNRFCRGKRYGCTKKGCGRKYRGYCCRPRKHYH